MLKGIFKTGKASQWIGRTVEIEGRKIRVKELIAEGGYAYVFKAQDLDTGETYALKRLLAQEREQYDNACREIQIWKSLPPHKNVVRLIGAEKFREDGVYEILILTELCSGGNLVNIMNQRLQNRFTEPELLRIFFDICVAVGHLHAQNPQVTHRDLKVENVLLAADGSWKLCDFGSATIKTWLCTNKKEMNELEMEVQQFTTMAYRAPEIVDFYHKKRIDSKIDIWALGCVLYKLAYFKGPFDDAGNLQIMNCRYNFPSIPPFSPSLRELITFMLNPDPEQRPNILTVLERLCALTQLPWALTNLKRHVRQVTVDLGDLSDSSSTSATSNSAATQNSSGQAPSNAAASESTAPNVAPSSRRAHHRAPSADVHSGPTASGILLDFGGGSESQPSAAPVPAAKAESRHSHHAASRSQGNFDGHHAAQVDSLGLDFSALSTSGAGNRGSVSLSSGSSALPPQPQPLDPFAIHIPQPSVESLIFGRGGPSGNANGAGSSSGSSTTSAGTLDIFGGSMPTPSPGGSSGSGSPSTPGLGPVPMSAAAAAAAAAASSNYKNAPAKEGGSVSSGVEDVFGEFQWHESSGAAPDAAAAAPASPATTTTRVVKKVVRKVVKPAGSPSTASTTTTARPTGASALIDFRDDNEADNVDSAAPSSTNAAVHHSHSRSEPGPAQATASRNSKFFDSDFSDSSSKPAPSPAPTSAPPSAPEKSSSSSKSSFISKKLASGASSLMKKVSKVSSQVTDATQKLVTHVRGHVTNLTDGTQFATELDALITRLVGREYAGVPPSAAVRALAVAVCHCPAAPTIEHRLTLFADAVRARGCLEHPVVCLKTLVTLLKLMQEGSTQFLQILSRHASLLTDIRSRWVLDRVPDRQDDVQIICAFTEYILARLGFHGHFPEYEGNFSIAAFMDKAARTPELHYKPYTERGCREQASLLGQLRQLRNVYFQTATKPFVVGCLFPLLTDESNLFQTHSFCLAELASTLSHTSVRRMVSQYCADYPDTLTGLRVVAERYSLPADYWPVLSWPEVSNATAFADSSAFSGERPKHFMYPASATPLGSRTFSARARSVRRISDPTRRRRARVLVAVDTLSDTEGMEAGADEESTTEFPDVETAAEVTAIRGGHFHVRGGSSGGGANEAGDGFVGEDDGDFADGNEDDDEEDNLGTPASTVPSVSGSVVSLDDVFGTAENDPFASGSTTVTETAASSAPAAPAAPQSLEDLFDNNFDSGFGMSASSASIESTGSKNAEASLPTAHLHSVIRRSSESPSTASTLGNAPAGILSVNELSKPIEPRDRPPRPPSFRTRAGRVAMSMDERAFSGIVREVSDSTGSRLFPIPSFGTTSPSGRGFGASGRSVSPSSIGANALCALPPLTQSDRPDRNHSPVFLGQSQLQHQPPRWSASTPMLFSTAAGVHAAADVQGAAVDMDDEEAEGFAPCRTNKTVGCDDDADGSVKSVQENDSGDEQCVGDNEFGEVVEEDGEDEEDEEEEGKADAADEEDVEYEEVYEVVEVVETVSQEVPMRNANSGFQSSYGAASVEQNLFQTNGLESGPSHAQTGYFPQANNSMVMGGTTMASNYFADGQQTSSLVGNTNANDSWNGFPQADNSVAANPFLQQMAGPTFPATTDPFAAVPVNSNTLPLAHSRHHTIHTNPFDDSPSTPALDPMSSFSLSVQVPQAGPHPLTMPIAGVASASPTTASAAVSTNPFETNPFDVGQGGSESMHSPFTSSYMSSGPHAPSVSFTPTPPSHPSPNHPSPRHTHVPAPFYTGDAAPVGLHSLPPAMSSSFLSLQHHQQQQQQYQQQPLNAQPVILTHQAYPMQQQQQSMHFAMDRNPSPLAINSDVGSSHLFESASARVRSLSSSAITASSMSSLPVSHQTLNTAVPAFDGNNSGQSNVQSGDVDKAFDDLLSARQRPPSAAPTTTVSNPVDSFDPQSARISVPRNPYALDADRRKSMPVTGTAYANLFGGALPIVPSPSSPHASGANAELDWNSVVSSSAIHQQASSSSILSVSALSGGHAGTTGNEDSIHQQPGQQHHLMTSLSSSSHLSTYFPPDSPSIPSYPSSIPTVQTMSAPSEPTQAQPGTPLPHYPSLPSPSSSASGGPIASQPASSMARFSPRHGSFAPSPIAPGGSLSMSVLNLGGAVPLSLTATPADDSSGAPMLDVSTSSALGLGGADSFDDGFNSPLTTNRGNRGSLRYEHKDDSDVHDGASSKGAGSKLKSKLWPFRGHHKRTKSSPDPNSFFEETELPKSKSKSGKAGKGALIGLDDGSPSAQQDEDGSTSRHLL